MHNTYTLPSKTYIDLDQPDIYQRFMRGYLELLQKNFKRYEAMDQNYNLREIRYSCRQAHDPRNPAWKPFQYLEQYCHKWGYDDKEARDVIEERIGRRLACECQLFGG